MRLREDLDGVPDHRSSQGRRHPLGAVLSLTVCAMLCGARSLYAIAQWGRDQGAAVGQELGFPLGRTPCAATLHRVFKGLDVDAFEGALREWVRDSGVHPGSVASIDGKTLRGIHGEELPGAHLASACATEGGAVLSQAGTLGKGQELAAAQAVLGQIPLKGRIVVADALLTQREVCQQIVAGGGDCLLPVKEKSACIAPGPGGSVFPHWKLGRFWGRGCRHGRLRTGGREGQS